MSGPKVVRIVTREEVIALCEGHLARLDVAVEEWLRVGRRNNTVSEAEAAATSARRDRLRRLPTDERLAELQKAVPDEIAYLQADQEARLAAAVAAAAQERTARRRVQAVAASVLAALRSAGRPVPPELRHALEDAAAGRTEDTAAISQGFVLLGRQEMSTVSDHQRRLADALKDGTDRISVREWLASHSDDADDAALARLERQLAALSATLDDADVAAFDARLRRAVAEAVPAHRRLLIDSLDVDLARAVAAARNSASLRGRLRMLAAELDRVGSAVAEEMARSIRAKIEGPPDVLAALETEMNSALARERERAAARARRGAVLQGLAALGYQVTEGLETAWVRDGRVVLEKPSQHGYGVELTGQADAGRMQLRAVAIRDTAAPADAARDRDAETLWCGDVTRLRDWLTDVGGDLVLERALPIGTVPLKTITEATDAHDAAHERRAPAAKRRH